MQWKGSDINAMLDRIEELMEGVRHVSNTIAQNLRTPLSRVRGHLDEALRANDSGKPLAEASQRAIQEVDALVIVLEKVLQISEAESGTRRQPFEWVHLREVVANVVELYDALAEEQGVKLLTRIEGDPKTLGDRHLLAIALANLIDNALKYGCGCVTIGVHAVLPGRVTLTVRDEGPGIPAEERPRVLQRFYRLNDRVPGTGLGLSIASAIAHLHGASLCLEDAVSGLLVRVDLPITPP